MGWDILYFARGRGRGHSLAGLAIAEQLKIVLPDVEIRFVSYGTGAQTLREHGIDVVDLDLPDQPSPFAIVGKLPLAFEGLSPYLVVAHEEFDVVAAAKLRRLPCVFLTDWFSNANDWFLQSLKHAEEILFLDDASVLDAQVFSTPEYLSKVRCVGPVLRPLRYQQPNRVEARLCARQDAGLPQDALIVSVFIRPGRRAEEIAPLSEGLTEAFNLIEAAPKMLLWDRDGDAEFDQTMAASDLAITKGNRNIVLELAALGVPTITVSHGLNVIDDIRTAALANNRTIPCVGLDPRNLANIMQTMISKGKSGEIRRALFENGASRVARELATRLGYPGNQPSDGNFLFSS